MFPLPFGERDRVRENLGENMNVFILGQTNARRRI